MAGIVRTWGQFVDDDLVVFGDEQFDGQNAGEFEAFGQSQRQLVRLLGHGFVHFGRRDGHVQDVVAMLVAHDREGHVILAVAGDEDARFEREIDEAFQNAWREAAVMVGAGAHLLQVGFGLEHGLAVAVVTAGTGFEHSRIVDLIKCRFKFLDAVDGLPRRGGRAMVVDEPLLVDTVCCVTRSRSVPCGAAARERT